MKNYFRKLRASARKSVQAVVSAFTFLFLLGFNAVPAYASGGGSEGGEASLTDTLGVFSEVFAWFLDEGANLLSWMLDKPIILLSLAIFFVGAVVGMLSRIYGSF